MDLFSGTKEQRTQLHFFDDGSFQFRKLPMKEACLVQEADGVVLKAWPTFYASEIQFDGYRNIPADMVTLSFDRDFILDIFNKVPVSETKEGKPKKDNTSITRWTAQIAESQRHKVMVKGGKLLLMDKITIFLGVALLLLVLVFALMKLT